MLLQRSNATTLRPSNIATWHNLAADVATWRDRCCSKMVDKGLSKLQPSDRPIVKATTLGPPDCMNDTKATTLRPLRPSDRATWHDHTAARTTWRCRCCSEVVAKGCVEATTLGPFDCKSYNPRTARLYHRPPSYNPPSAATVGSCHVARS